MERVEETLDQYGITDAPEGLAEAVAFAVLQVEAISGRNFKNIRVRVADEPDSAGPGRSPTHSRLRLTPGERSDIVRSHLGLQGLR